MYIIDPKLPKERLNEYSRRNLLHASSVGAHANARTARKRLLETKRPQKWLIALLDGVIERAAKVESEMAKHRDEIEIYVEETK